MKKTILLAVRVLSLALVAAFVLAMMPSIGTAVTAAESEFVDALYKSATQNHADSRWDTVSATLKKNYPTQMALLTADAQSANVEISGLGSNSSRLVTMYAIALVAVKAVNDQSVLDKVNAAYNAKDVKKLMQEYADMFARRSYASFKSLYDFANAYIVVKNKCMGGSHYAYTEALSDDKGEEEGGAEVNFFPGSQLVLLTLKESSNGIETNEEVLIDLPDGVIRDPDVSPDGTRVLFSMKKARNTDDYHLYELDLKTRSVRQLTSGEGVSETECSYLPSGNIVFQSSRCVQTVDCWKTPVSNLYICDPDGGNIRRVGYDQVHTSYTSVTSDGRVIYTRWDYNDRTQMYVQALFQMNEDGTNQTELFGGNSSFPTTLLHARQVTGSDTKYVAIASGHHTYQGGKLVMVDVSRGRNSKDAVKYVFPDDGEDFRDNIDTQNQDGAIYRYPYAISETQFLVSYSPDGWSGDRSRTPFGIYYMTTDGTKALLVAGTEDLPAGQIVPIRNRDLFTRASMVNYAKNTGTYYIGNVYEGEAMAGVKFGDAKYLRVVALEFRSAAIGTNNNSNPSIAGSGTAYTPVSTANGTWDVKVPLGIVEICDDGSCLFEVPSETPLYFQVLNKDYELIASMRSWSTLQPNEYYSCVGCHEDKNTVPPSTAARSLAMEGGVKKIVPEDWMTAAAGYTEYDPYTDKIGFSYDKVIQPILDENCVSCHNNQSISNMLISGTLPYTALKSADLSKYATAYTYTEYQNLVGFEEILSINASGWKYTFGNPGSDDWFTADYDKSAWNTGDAPFSDGESKGTRWSGGNMQIWIAKDINVTAAQADKTVRIRLFNDEDVEVYLNGEKIYAAGGYVTTYHIYEINGLKLKQGKNHIAIHCTQTTGGRKVDCGIFVSKTEKAKSVQKADLSGVFSLEGTLIKSDNEKRDFNLSYLVLTQSTKQGREWRAPVANGWTNWISSQSQCEVLKPYSSGSSKSKLIDLLQSGHGGLSEAQIHAFETWNDLSVPFAGTYDEHARWSDNEWAYYKKTVEKRAAQQEIDDISKGRK